MNLAVDVISDVICPWCYIGKKRLEKAIAPFESQQQVRARWLPFQLNATMPNEGISRREYRIRKFGSWERSMELDATVVAVGEREGIPIRTLAASRRVVKSSLGRFGGRSVKRLVGLVIGALTP